jgi:tetratricopeptide (TPR) repeat protein
MRVRVLPGLPALALMLPLTAMTADVDLDAFWEYGNPAASEARFRAALDSSGGDTRLEIETQIARTYGLRKQFAEAHTLLDSVEPRLAGAGPAPRVRYLLERGRTFNSAGDKARAQVLFEQAWELASANRLDGLAVDAAHMLAIVLSGSDAALWTARGVELARASNDAKAHAMMPALLNNHAWNLFDAGTFDAALPVFREAESAWHATGRQPQGRIATWSVARCLRALQRYDEALALQLALEAEWTAAGSADGYVYEELAELYEAKSDTVTARRYFAQAARQLAKDPDFVRTESARLKRLVERGG